MIRWRMLFSCPLLHACSCLFLCFKHFYGFLLSRVVRYRRKNEQLAIPKAYGEMKKHSAACCRPVTKNTCEALCAQERSFLSSSETLDSAHGIGWLVCLLTYSDSDFYADSCWICFIFLNFWKEKMFFGHAAHTDKLPVHEPKRNGHTVVHHNQFPCN